MESLRRSCAKVREPSELWFGVVRGVDRGLGVLDGVYVQQTEGEVFGMRGFVPNFNYSIPYWVADGEVFRIRL